MSGFIIDKEVLALLNRINPYSKEIKNVNYSSITKKLDDFEFKSGSPMSKPKAPVPSPKTPVPSPKAPVPSPKAPIPKKQAECNKRNPEPPCKPGFVSRKRTNGFLCCYKDYQAPKSKKQPQPEQTTKPKQPSEPLSSNDEPIFQKFKRKQKLLNNKQKSTVKRFKIKRKEPVADSKPLNTQKTNKPPEKHLCNKRNPAPPCKPGFVSRKRPNGSLCCYKDYGAPAEPKKFKIKRISKKVNNPQENKNKCNTRNPEPPCKEGYYKKARPNGDICCFKGTIAQTKPKSSKKIKEIHGKSLVKIIEMVDNLDFPYKPVVYEDIDVKLDFTKLNKKIQKYILVLDKANLNFKFNKPLAENFHIYKKSDLGYLNNFYSKEMEKVMNDATSRFYHYLVNVEEVQSNYGNVKNDVLLLVRNQGSYIRYGVEIYNYPPHLRNTKHNLF